MLIQFLLFIAYIFNFESMTILLRTIVFWFGIFIFVLGGLTTVIAVLQLNVHLSPFPSPLPDSKLIENGVYKFIRHPIYTGIILAFFGFAFITDSGYRLLISAVLFALFYYKTLYEEKRLIENFPNYLEYRNRSGRFFPFL